MKWKLNRGHIGKGPINIEPPPGSIEKRIVGMRYGDIVERGADWGQWDTILKPVQDARPERSVKSISSVSPISHGIEVRHVDVERSLLAPMDDLLAESGVFVGSLASAPAPVRPAIHGAHLLSAGSREIGEFTNLPVERLGAGEGFGVIAADTVDASRAGQHLDAMNNGSVTALAAAEAEAAEAAAVVAPTEERSIRRRGGSLRIAS